MVDEAKGHMASGNADSTSSPSSIARLYRKKCMCAIEAAMKTSFTKENFGRRFLGCANYRVPTD
jgi:hypothetical protein